MECEEREDYAPPDREPRSTAEAEYQAGRNQWDEIDPGSILRVRRPGQQVAQPDQANRADRSAVDQRINGCRFVRSGLSEAGRYADGRDETGPEDDHGHDCRRARPTPGRRFDD